MVKSELAALFGARYELENSESERATNVALDAIDGRWGKASELNSVVWLFFAKSHAVPRRPKSAQRRVGIGRRKAAAVFSRGQGRAGAAERTTTLNRSARAQLAIL